MARGKTQANQSVGKALRLLDYFRTHPVARLSDLADHADLSPSTALRLVLALEENGALVRDHDTREYSIGPWIFELAATTVRFHPFSKFVHEMLMLAREETGETVSYYIREGDHRLCMDRVQSRHALSSTVDVGVRLPLHRGAAGRVLLAFAAEPDRERLLKEVAANEDDVDLDELEKSLEAVIAKGVAVSVEERERGLAAVAVPVLDRNGNLLGALTVSGPTSRFTAALRRAAIPVLQTAAERVASYRMFEE